MYVKGRDEMETETALCIGRPHNLLPHHQNNNTPQHNTNRFIVVPLMAGYALYSLLHERHKSWYSWAVTSLTGFVYVFGFVMMTPQVSGANHVNGLGLVVLYPCGSGRETRALSLVTQADS